MEHILRLLPKKPQPIWVRYGSTFLIVAVFFLLRAGLEERVGTYGFFLMTPAIFLPAVLFDRGSGFIATALSAAFIYFFVGGDLGLESLAQHAVPFGLFVAISISIATVSEALRKALERAVAEENAKKLLLDEMGHRIKNNLQTVASLLQMQARSQRDPEARANMEDAVARVYAIANAHDFLRPGTHENSVDMRSYLEDLGERLAVMLRGNRPVAVCVDAEAVHLPSERAILVGLIVNELVTNAFKHAFRDAESGTIDVRFARAAEGFELIVADDGTGGKQEEGTPQREGFGTRLIRLIVEQLDGKMTRDNPGSGRRVTVRLP